MKRLTSIFLAVGALCIAAVAQTGYKKPPANIQEILDAPAIPATSISPTRDKIALLEPLRYPPVADLAQPMLRLAGTRVNPNTNAPHLQGYSVSMKLKNITDGREVSVALPAGAKISGPQWSPDGKHIAFGNITPTGVELWIVDTATAKARKVNNVLLNTAFGGYSWEGSSQLSAGIIPSGRGQAPAYQNTVPTAPNIQETTGRRGTVPTVQDLLRSPNDERLYDYYATAQLALIGVDGKVRNVGQPAIFNDASFSPDGKYVYVSMVRRPYSYIYPASRFPKAQEIWDATGKVVHKLPDVPLLDNIAPQGVPVGPRNISWIPIEPATLSWVEALDGGDPRTKVSQRDKIMKFAAPFAGSPSEMFNTEHRFQGRSFGEKDGAMFYYDFNRDTQRRRMFLTTYQDPSNAKQVFDLNINDRYNDIGAPLSRVQPNGVSLIRQDGDEIYLTGTGASPDGDRPFLRRMNLKTLKIEEMYRSGVEGYEAFVALLNDDSGRFITRRESVVDPPNLFLRQVCPAGKVCTAMESQRITDFKDPSPQLRGITKRLVQYKRADGVDLSFTLYLPPGYKEGTRLPTIVWAYPESFTDAGVAGQVAGSTNRFTQIGGYSHLFLLLSGYAILDNTSMPVVGPPETKNDTFIKQIVDASKAAIDKAAELGVTDPDRVGVGGHSYGAFMTANLLAHSDLFRAGVARSGAYNRTLTPFGFQDEIRDFWQATRIYTEVSPFFYANKINEPILLIHGEADNNQGTFPIQSERLFAAISGNGGTARLVMLPHESHGYSARESTEHTLAETIEWFDKYVKNAKPRTDPRAGN
ncbi:MAG: prolyl oligopeptidase family serine peptidase [bacterium]|nr:prolyl oligopeptidase family serine peptidase [bacterium]